MLRLLPEHRLELDRARTDHTPGRIQQLCICQPMYCMLVVNYRMEDRQAICSTCRRDKQLPYLNCQQQEMGNPLVVSVLISIASIKWELRSIVRASCEGGVSVVDEAHWCFPFHAQVGDGNIAHCKRLKASQIACSHCCPANVAGMCMKRADVYSQVTYA